MPRDSAELSVLVSNHCKNSYDSEILINLCCSLTTSE